MAFHGGLAVNRLDMEFQVDARTFGFIDRSLLRAHGETFALTAGITWRTGSRGRLGAEVFYSPLEVQRSAQATEDDDLVNLRLIWRWRAR